MITERQQDDKVTCDSEHKALVVADNNELHVHIDTASAMIAERQRDDAVTSDDDYKRCSSQTTANCIREAMQNTYMQDGTYVQ